MNYGDLIRDAFLFALRNRFLWFFGLFVGIGTPFIAFTGFVSAGPNREFSLLISRLFQWVGENISLIRENAGLFLIVVAALVLLMVSVWIVLIMISWGGLDESVATTERGEGHHFSSTLRAGLSNFWPVLGQTVLFLLIWVGLFLAVCLPAMAALVHTLAGTFPLTNSTAARVLAVMFEIILLILLLVGTTVPLTIISQFALRELVIGGKGVIGSIGSGYRVFGRNLGRSLLLFLIQSTLAFGVDLVLPVVANAAGLFLSVPVALLSSSGPTAASVVVLGVFFSIPLVALSGAIGAFYHAFWTLAYLRLTASSEQG